MPLPEGIGALLVDIEGTTTSISFVYDVLFPYAAARLDEYCSRSDPEPELAEALARLRSEYEEEIACGAAFPPFGDGAN